MGLIKPYKELEKRVGQQEPRKVDGSGCSIGLAMAILLSGVLFFATKGCEISLYQQKQEPYSSYEQKELEDLFPIPQKYSK